MKPNWQLILLIAVPIVAAMIAVIGEIYLKTHYRSELWYEQGSYYRSADQAIASLKIQNYGHADAEGIRIKVSFPDAILNVTTGDEAIPFTITSGAIGSRTVGGTIPRLVPDESVYLYIAVKNPDGPIPSSYANFVSPKGIVYDGGIANEGQPSHWLSLAVSWAIIAFSWAWNILILKKLKRQGAIVDALGVRATELGTHYDELLQRYNKLRDSR
jgi:hypothetical protein